MNTNFFKLNGISLKYYNNRRCVVLFLLNRILKYFFLEDKILPRKLYFIAVTKKERNFGFDELSTTICAYTLHVVLNKLQFKRH